MIPYPRWKRNKNRLEFYDKTILSKQISIVKTALFLSIKLLTSKQAKGTINIIRMCKKGGIFYGTKDTRTYCYSRKYCWRIF